MESLTCRVSNFVVKLNLFLTQILSTNETSQDLTSCSKKPNATRLALEGLIVFSNNKTAAWHQIRSEKDRETLFKRCRKLGCEFIDLYNQRRQKLLEDRAKVLRDKQLALQQLRGKKFREKETLTEEVMVYSLWKN